WTKLNSTSGKIYISFLMKFLVNSKFYVNQALIFNVLSIIRNMSSYSIKPYQGTVSGQRHVEISKWFGELESTFYKHHKSPHPDVFRVSNNEAEGCTNVGRTGWHIDGSFQEAPFAYSLYHMVSIPKSGDTVFIPLNELLKNLSKEQFARWDRLWMVSDRRGQLYHPLVYSHPSTGELTMCVHLGMTDAFIWDYGTEKQKITNFQETLEILKEIKKEFATNQKHLQYSHKWEPGDFIISDNLALGHEASEQTQFPVSEVGLRVLHRTTVKGTVIPAKSNVCHSKGDMC
ncbi:unnamed protein product, partial [Owenia fusiformis]